MPAARLEWRQRIYFVIMVLLAGAGSVRVRAADARVSPLALGMNMHGFPSTEPWHGFDARRRLVEFIKSAFDKSGG